MMEFGLFSVVLGLVGLASFVWLVIVAFRESLIWCLLVFFFSPISAIAFSIYHWDEAKKPFLIYLATTIILIVMFFSAFNKMGGMETIEVTQQAADQLEKGEITEVEAAKRVAEQMESNIKRMEDAGLIGADESRMLEEKVQGLKLDESASPVVTKTPATSTSTSTSVDANPEMDKTQLDSKVLPVPDAKKTKTIEALPVTKPAEEKLEYGPDWSLEGALEKKREKYKQQQLDLPEPKLEGSYVPISVSRAEEYIGQAVRVVKEKNVYNGLLKAVNENFLILDMQVSGGQAHFEVKRHHVRSMYLLKIPPRK